MKLTRHNHLFKSIDLEWEDVKSVKRAYSLIIIPDKIKIIDKNNRKYYFYFTLFQGKEKNIKRAFKEYQNSQKE